MVGYGIDIEMNRIRRILHRLKLSKGKGGREREIGKEKKFNTSNKQSIYFKTRDSRGISFKIGSFWIRYQVQYAFVRQTPIKLHRSHQFTEGMSMGLLDSISSNVIRYHGKRGFHTVKFLSISRKNSSFCMKGT